VCDLAVKSELSTAYYYAFCARATPLTSHEPVTTASSCVKRPEVCLHLWKTGVTSLGKRLTDLYRASNHNLASRALRRARKKDGARDSLGHDVRIPDSLEVSS